MSKLKTLLGLISAGCIIAALALPLCEAAENSNSETRIKALRFSVKGNRTCLIFDAEGDSPKQIGPASADGISVFFTQITAKLPDKVFQGKNVAAKEVKFRREAGFFEVLFREKNTSVSSRVKPGKNEKYTLTLELTPPSKGTQQQQPPSEAGLAKSAGGPAVSGSAPAPDAQVTRVPGTQPSQIEVKKVETSELFGSKVPQQVINTAVNALRPKEGGSARPAGSASKPGAFVEPDEKALALYASANGKFEDCSRNLVYCAPETVQAYEEALQAGPRSSQAPMAMYRSGLAHSLMGNYAKADKLFRQVTVEWPDSPVACRCWIGIGDIYNKRQAYLEAMEAFRGALRRAVDKDDKAAACYELGKMYQMLGANKEALEMLENCLGQDPDYYTKKPDISRFMGDAQFALGNIEKAKELLLRYVNYQQSTPDQDTVLAKIAEIFLIQGDLGAARKMYSFIGKYYENSEGDLICRVRSAELMEIENPEQAITMYSDLLGKDLSPSLGKIVLMKLAALNLKKGDLARSLDLMDEAFPAKKDGSSPGGTSELREKILCSLVSQYFSSRNFIQVVQLHDKYLRVFSSIHAPEVLEQIAECYASLKFYSKALEIYDSLFAKGRIKGDDLLLRCAVYALRINDGGRAFQFCKLAQSESVDLKKSEILGHIFMQDHNYSEAVKYFGKILQKGKELELEAPDSLASYGYCLYQTRKFEEAVPVLQKALQREKAMEPYARRLILVTLGRCFAELKEFQKAAEMMETAIQTSGEDQKNELMYDISTLYMAAGQPDKAIEHLNRIKATEDPFWGPVAQQQINTIEMGQAKAGL